MFYTHMIFSSFIFFIYFLFIGKNFDFSFIQISYLLITVFFSLLSDIDSSKSKFGRKFIFSFLFKHRGILHSIYPLIFLYLINIYAFLGYSSHLILDSLTKKGIKPFNTKFKIKGFIKTGSIFEKATFFCIFLGLVYILSI